MCKKSLLMMLLMALFAPWAAKAQTTVTIGEGTATSNTNPIGTYYNYSITEQLYTAEEIGMAGTINSVSFYYMGIAAKDLPITMYMANVDAADLSTGGISLADADEVFSGTLSVTTTAGWVTINLDTPFAYDGQSNLLIGFIKDYLYYFSGQSWQGTATTTTMARYTQSDSAGPYTTGTVPGTAQANRPNIQLNITAGSGPVCDKPETIELSEINATYAAINWTGGSGTYNIEYKKASDQDWIVRETNYGPGYYGIGFPNLEPNTAYNARVQSVCTDGLSAWKSISFTTPAALPIVEAFTETSVPAGWNRYTGLLSDVLSGTALTASTSGWYFTTTNGVFDNHARVNIYGTSCKYWLVTPTVLMEQNVQLTFDLALTAYSGTLGAPATDGTDDKFVVLINVDGAWTILRQWDNTGSEYVYNNINSTATGENIAIDLSSYAGQNIAIAFYGESTESNADNNLHIDNVSIDYIPDCAKPTGLAISNVTAHAATLSWTSDATAWQIGYTAANGNEQYVEVTENPYTLTNLIPETAYQVRVQTNCGSGVYSIFTNPVSFTTAIACTVPTGITASNLTGHGVTMTWTAEEGAWYQYQMIKTDAYDPENINWSASFEGNTLSWDNLNPETGYTFTLRKDCSEAEDGYSQIVTRTFTTTVACPAPTVAASNITTTTAELSCTNTDAELFNVLVVNDSTLYENVAMPYTLTDLTMNTSYTVQVKALCGGDDGESAWSSGTTFMTAEECPNGMVCIGTGTSTNTNLPANNFYNYSLSEQIYTAAEIGMEGQISSIEFYKASTTTMNVDLVIYMVSTTKDEFTSTTDWIPVTSNDIVYQGTVTFVDNDWTNIELQNPFNYDGTSNLCIVVDNNTGSYESSTPFRVFSATKNQTLYQYSDGTNLDPTASITTTGSRTASKNRIRIAIGEPPACAKPLHVAVNYEGGTTATVTWEGDATSYNIDVNGTVTEGVTSPYTLEGLELATTYAVMMQANCGSGMLSDWTTAVSFTTDLCLPENQCELTFVLTDSYGDGWNGNAIVVTDVLTGDILATMANQNLDGTTGEETQTVTLAVCDGRELQFSWTTGSYIGEVSYTVTDVNGEVIVEGSGAGFETFNYTVSCLVTNCRKPTNLAVSEIGGHSAVLSWTENGEATEWVVEVADLESGQINVWNTTTNPYTIVGLSPETEHSVKVRPVCTDLDNLWSEKIIFTTDVACPAPMQLNITDITSNSAVVNWGGEGESFDLRIGTIAEQVELRNTLTYDFEDSDMQGWTNIDADGDGYEWVLGSLAGGVYLAEGGSLAGQGHDESTADFVTSGSYSNYTSSALTPDNYLVSPAIVLGGSISFWACAQDASYAAEHFGVAVSTTSNTDPTAFTTIQEWTIGGRDQSGWVLYTVDLSAYSGVGYVAIRHFDCTDMFMLDVDDIAIEEGFLGEIEWSEPITGVTSPYQLTDLTPETYYFVQVRANCGDEGYSEWAQVGFTTKGLCDVPTNLTTTDIDAYTATLNWNGAQERYNVQYRTTSHRNPIYFTNFNTDEARQGWTFGYAIYGITDPIYHIPGSSNYFLEMGWNTTEEAYIISPELPEYEEGSTLEFYYFGYSTQNTFQVGYSSTTSDIDAFTWSEPIDAPLTQYTLYSEVLPAGIKYVAFKATASEQNATVFIDDFGIFRNDTPAGEWITTSARGNTLTIESLTPETEYEWQVQGINPSCDGGVTEWSDMATFTTTPSCLVPTDLTVSDVTSNSAVLSWTSTATLFDIKVNDEMIEGVTTPYTLENLDPETIYYVYVRANCGDGDYSDWTDFIAFVTDCGGAKDLPYAYDFEDQGEYYACWTASSFNTSNNVGLVTIDNSTVFRFSSYSSATDYRQILVSPELNTENAVVVSFDYRTSNTSAETFQVGYATGDYTSIEDFTFGEAISVNNNTEWATYTETLPAGAKYVAVLYSSSYQYYLYVDNFIFDEPAPGITQTTELSEGWNWVSTYIDAEDPVAMLDMLKESLGENGLRIESAYYTTEFDGEEWFGDLDDEGINNVEMYLIEVSTDCAIELQGMPANPANHSITIEPGYTWIGFPCAEEVEIAVALADFEAEEGDQIESAEGLTEFDGEEWFGDIETLVPGQGYLYYSASEDTKTLVFLTMTRRADANSRRLFDTMVDRIRPVNCKVINK